MKIRVGAATMVAGAIAASLAFYTISLRISAERAEVERLKAQIAADTREVRSLEAELRTRARLPVLQRWNDEVLALQAALPKQFIDSPAQLAAYAPGGAQLPTSGPAMPQLAVANSATPTVLPQVPPLQTVAYSVPLAKDDNLPVAASLDLGRNNQAEAMQLNRPAQVEQRRATPLAAAEAASASGAGGAARPASSKPAKPASVAMVTSKPRAAAEAKAKPVAPVKPPIPARDDPLGALIADVDGAGGATP